MLTKAFLLTTTAAISSLVCSDGARAQAGGVFNGSTYGMKCDGKIADDDTPGLNATFLAAQNAGGGTVVLPAGVCEFSQPPTLKNSRQQLVGIKVPGFVNLQIEGAGLEATKLSWNQPGNFIDIGLSSYASVTVQDLSIIRPQGTLPAGTEYSGIALNIHSGDNNHFFAGSAGVERVTISGQSSSDGWSVGLEIGDLAGSAIDTVQVTNPGFSGSITGLPSPTQPGPTPSSLGTNVADDILISGIPSNATGAPADYASDTTVSNSSTSGGLVGLDAQDFQGIYVSNSHFLYSKYGLRAENPAGDTQGDELVNVGTSHFNDDVGDIYLVSVPNSEITGTLIFHANPVSPWTGIWLNNSGQSTVTGNSILGGSSGPYTDYGIYISGSGSAGGYPLSISGNSIYSLNGVGISNDSGSTNVVATGNSEVGVSTAALDPTGKNNYIGNNFASSGPSTAPVASSSLGTSAGHATRQFALWAYAQGTFTLTTDGRTAQSGNELASVPVGSSPGTIMVAGDVVCSNPNFYNTWHFTGTWSYSPSTLSLLHFLQTSSDGQPANNSGWKLQGGVDTGANVPQVQFTGSSTNVNCSGTAAETFVQ